MNAKTGEKKEVPRAWQRCNEEKAACGPRFSLLPGFGPATAWVQL